MPQVTFATPADIEALSQLQYDAFCDDYFRTMFPGQAGLGFYNASWEKFMPHRRSRKSDEPAPPEGDNTAAKGVQSEILTIKGDDGEIQSAAIYWFMPQGVSILDVPSKNRWPAYTEGLPKDELDEFFATMSTQHSSVMHSDAHVFLEIIMTHPGAQKKGHGSALLAFGNSLADEADIPCYLDSDPTARFLYEKNGYVYLEDKHLPGGQLLPMKRPRKSERQ